MQRLPAMLFSQWQCVGSAFWVVAFSLVLLTAPARVIPARDRIPVTVLWVGNTLRQRSKNEWILPVAGFAGGGVLGELLWGNRLDWCLGQAPAVPLEGQGWQQLRAPFLRGS